MKCDLTHFKAIKRNKQVNLYTMLNVPEKYQNILCYIIIYCITSVFTLSRVNSVFYHCGVKSLVVRSFYSFHFSVSRVRNEFVNFFIHLT